MFFKNNAETLGIVPNYMIDDILKLSSSFSPTNDPRAVLGKSNQIQGFGKMPLELQRNLTQISAYILSQHIPVLKSMVVYESLLVFLPTQSDIVMPTRYLCRIGELVIAPLQGQVTMYSREFADPVVMQPGSMYRINNRIDSRFIASEDFVSAAYNFLDFDLKRHLMPHDISSPFVRRKDEYLDPDKAAPDPEVPADAY